MKVYGQELILPPSVLSKAQEDQITKAAKEYAAQRVGEAIAQKILTKVNLDLLYPNLNDVIEHTKDALRKGLNRAVENAIADLSTSDW